jgi:hypothetical protein
MSESGQAAQEGGSWRRCLGRSRQTDRHQRESMSTMSTTPTSTWLPRPRRDWRTTVPYRTHRPTAPRRAAQSWSPQVSETRGVGQHVFDRPVQEGFNVLAVGPWSHSPRHDASRRKFCLATPPEPPRESRDTAAVAAGREPSVASPAVIATRAMAPGVCEIRCLDGRGEAVAQKRRA